LPDAFVLYAETRLENVDLVAGGVGVGVGAGDGGVHCEGLAGGGVHCEGLAGGGVYGNGVSVVGVVEYTGEAAEYTGGEGVVGLEYGLPFSFLPRCVGEVDEMEVTYDSAEGEVGGSVLES
jgi:hypothetical protein